MQAGQGVKLLNILRKYCEGEKLICSAFVKTLITTFCFIWHLILILEAQVSIMMMPYLLVQQNICSPIQYLKDFKLLFLYSSGCNEPTTSSHLFFYLLFFLICNSLACITLKFEVLTPSIPNYRLFWLF